MSQGIVQRKGWSRIGQLAKGAAISQANRARAERDKEPGKKWSARETQIIIQGYPDYDLLQKQLPKRSYDQIRSYCLAIGITTKRHVWKKTELALLKRLWESGVSTVEIRAQLPFETTNNQVTARARYEGFFRPAKPIAKTGHPIIDAVRQRCRDQGYQFTDLDEWCASKRYWASNCGAGKPMWPYIIKAVEILDGELAILWRQNSAKS